jgi:acyl-CoA thioesterase FadM
VTPSATAVSNGSTGTTPLDGVLAATTSAQLRPRYEGSNICTWIGFKHVNYLVEEAVLEHLRQSGLAPGELYERYGLCVDLVDIDTRIMHAFHIDDVAGAEVGPPRGGPQGQLRFAVRLYVQRDQEVQAVAAKVRVVLRLDPRGGGAESIPAYLQPHVVDRLGADPAGTTVAGDLSAVEVADRDPLTVLVDGRNAVGWAWRMPYFYCHYTRRVQMSGYLRLMEEVVDVFLHERGISIRTLLDEQDWIPVVPQSRITILDEALMEETVHTVFTVESVFKDFTYTARMDCYVLRDGVLVPTATGRITHGYAVIENRRDWSLVSFDERMLAGLAGPASTATGRGVVRSGSHP